MCRWPVGYWDGVDQDDSGVASAMVNTMQQVGGALGLAIFTSISTSAVGRYVSSTRGSAATGSKRWRPCPATTRSSG